jgi:hypothetical protein
MTLLDRDHDAVGLILDPVERELLARLVRAYRLCPAADDIPVLDGLAQRLS